MEVHPPEHPIHTWRDFFIHIATIVVGLLIAIGLEQSVEWFHHRHLLHTAREQLREEMRHNRATVEHDQSVLARLQADLQANLKVLDTQGPLDEHKPMRINFQWDGPSESAWRAAEQNQTLSLMPYEELQAYSYAYMQQQIVQRAAEQFLRDHTAALGPILRHGDPRTLQYSVLTSDDRTELARDFAQNLSETMVLHDLLRDLDTSYRDVQRLQP